MTSQGSAQGRFQRALDRDQVLQAEMAARELGYLSLSNALALVVCYARAGIVVCVVTARRRRS